MKKKKVSQEVMAIARMQTLFEQSVNEDETSLMSAQEQGTYIDGYRAALHNVRKTFELQDKYNK